MGTGDKKIQSSMMVSHWGAYHTKVEDGRLTGVTAIEADSAPSPMVASMPGAVHAKSRVPQPMVRAGFLADGANSDRTGRGREPFVPVSWDRALDIIAGELKRTIGSYGSEAIFGGSYGWASSGRFHSVKSQMHRFLNMTGGYVDHLTTYSSGAAQIILPHIFGEVVRGSQPWPIIAEHAKLIVMFGGAPLKNAQIEHGGSGAHFTEPWLRAAKKNGAKFINIGPIKEDAAAFLDAEWISPRPNTDTALLAAIAYTLITDGLHDLAFLRRYCTGFEKVSPYILGQTDGQKKDADWAASICNIPADTIRALAHRMAGNPTMIMLSLSVQRGDHGEQPYWMAVLVGALLGQMNLPGCGVGFGYGAMDNVGKPRSKVLIPSVPVGKNPVANTIPVARLSDMLLTPGGSYDFNGEKRTYPDIRLVYWCGGNPFHHHQDINRMLEAWRRPETIIAHEQYWTGLARHADIVLPATTTLERNDIGGAPGDRFLIAMKQAIDPVGDARSDYDIFAGLAERFGLAGDFTEGRDEMAWLNHLYETARGNAAEKGLSLPEFTSFWELGVLELPDPGPGETQFADFWREPEAHPLKTPSGKIELFSETIDRFNYDDCLGHAVWMEPVEWLGGKTAKKFGLHMISNQPTTRLHSQLDMAGASLDSKVRGREPVWIHPADAAARDIIDGDIVRLFNDRGACLAGAVITDKVMQGVVQLQTGAWYDPIEPGEIGSMDRHGNPNLLTIDKGTSKLAQACIAHTALVELETWDGEVPPITVFSQPPINTAVE